MLCGTGFGRRMKAKMDNAVAWAVLGVAVAMVVAAVVHLEWILA